MEDKGRVRWAIRGCDGAGRGLVSEWRDEPCQRCTHFVSMYLSIYA